MIDNSLLNSALIRSRAVLEVHPRWQEIQEILPSLVHVVQTTMGAMQAMFDLSEDEVMALFVIIISRCVEEVGEDVNLN